MKNNNDKMQTAVRLKLSQQQADDRLEQWLKYVHPYKTALAQDANKFCVQMFLGLCVMMPV